MRLSWLRSILLLFLSLGALFGWPSRKVRAQTPEQSVTRFGCAHCHTLPGIARRPQNACVSCHQGVVQQDRRRRYGRRHIRHYLDVPRLTHVTSRLRRDYLLGYLQDPHDIRSRQEETMPRLPVGPNDARAILTFLEGLAPPPRRPAPTPVPSPTRIPEGRQAFLRYGCPTCHDVGNLRFPNAPNAETLARSEGAVIQGPNLRFVRDRIAPDIAVAWIQNPQSIDPDSPMPNFGIQREEAIAIRDFLFLTELGEPVRPRLPPRADMLTALPRRVHFEEVRRIVRRSCIHCHAHTNGSGSQSAFGFPEGELDLSTAAGFRAGVLLPGGDRRSIIEAAEGRLPPIVQRLVQRHEEAQRDLMPRGQDPLQPVMRTRPTAPVGMPLGLPPVPLEDIRVILTWIEQGTH